MDIISAFIVVPKSDIVHPARCDAEEMISAGRAKWARQDSNLGPRDYESPALTAELQAQTIHFQGFTIWNKNRTCVFYGALLRFLDETQQRNAKRLAEYTHSIPPPS